MAFIPLGSVILNIGSDARDLARMTCNPNEASYQRFSDSKSLCIKHGKYFMDLMRSVISFSLQPSVGIHLANFDN